MMKTINKPKNDAAERQFLSLEEHLLCDETPSNYIWTMLEGGQLDDYPFSMLKKLKGTPQSPVHHPEGDVFNHTLLVLDEAAKRKEQSRDPRAFMWAALLHDIGKPATTRTRKGRITAYDHDREGEAKAREFLSSLTAEQPFIDTVTALVRYHMQVLYVVNDLPFKDIAGMKRRSDVGEVALLCLCDRLGRMGADRKKEEAQVQRFVEYCDKHGN